MAKLAGKREEKGWEKDSSDDVQWALPIALILATVALLFGISTLADLMGFLGEARTLDWSAWNREDLAGIKRREKLSLIFFVKKGKEIEQIVLPVNGKGLWSTLYGFIALEGDMNTVSGLTFYQHGETPGLGGEVDNPAWKAKWVGKMAFGEDLEPQLEVIKGTVDPGGKRAAHQVDGLSGATITSLGVTNLLRYWLGDHGFGPFLKRLRKEGGLDG